jgi:DNA polymerase-3 subunit delta
MGNRGRSGSSNVRCYLFYGGDEAGSRSLAAKVAEAFNPDAERVDLLPAQIKADPAVLADEAASMSLFGAQRYIRVDGAGDECLPAVETILSAPLAGHPIILLAGPLKKDSKLLRRLERDPNAQITVSHPLDAKDLARVAVTLGAEHGLRINGEIAVTIAESSGGDRTILTREIEKLALFLDASLDRPQTLTVHVSEALGADRDEADATAIADLVCSGSARALAETISRLPSGDGEALPIVRVLLKRMLAMAAARGEIDRGTDARSASERAGRRLFWKDRDKLTRDVQRWSGRRLDAGIEHLLQIERTIKSGRGAGVVALHQLLNRMARSSSKS